MDIEHLKHGGPVFVQLGPETGYFSFGTVASLVVHEVLNDAEGRAYKVKVKGAYVQDPFFKDRAFFVSVSAPRMP